MQRPQGLNSKTSREANIWSLGSLGLELHCAWNMGRITWVGETRCSFYLLIKKKLIFLQEHSLRHWKSMNTAPACRLELTNPSGGSAGAVYAFIFAWTGTACCFSVLAELASM